MSPPQNIKKYISKEQSKCILLISIYNLDRIPEITELLLRNHIKIDVSFANKNKNHKLTKLFINTFRDRILRIRYHDNYGADVAPFLRQIVSLDSEKFPYFIKLHSKASLIGEKLQVDWGSFLISGLLHSSDLYTNLKILSKPYIGMMVHPGLILKDAEFNNSDKIQQICSLLQLPYNKLQRGEFPAGNMFMSKTSIFQKYFSTKQAYIDTLLSQEKGKVNDSDYAEGTYSHALERVFGYIIANSNKKIINHPLQYNNYQLFNEKHRKLHLNISYNNLCYLEEDINIAGKIISQSSSHMQIQWLHLDDKPIIEYNIFDRKKIKRC